MSSSLVGLVFSTQQGKTNCILAEGSRPSAGPTHTRVEWPQRTSLIKTHWCLFSLILHVKVHIVFMKFSGVCTRVSKKTFFFNFVSSV